MVNINSIKWEIKVVSPDHPELIRYDGIWVPGVCDDKTKIIYLSSHLYGPNLKKVLCHEITHAVLSSYNIIIPIEQEEMLADLLATHGEEILAITYNLIAK